MNEDLIIDAEKVVTEFMTTHKAAAIPAIMGYCVMWSVDNGGIELIKETLARLSLAADDMEKVRLESAQ